MAKLKGGRREADQDGYAGEVLDQIEEHLLVQIQNTHRLGCLNRTCFCRHFEFICHMQFQDPS